jgi:hypothetical protein
LKIGSKMLKMKSQIPLILVGKSPHWKNMKWKEKCININLQTNLCYLQKKNPGKWKRKSPWKVRKSR